MVVDGAWMFAVKNSMKRWPADSEGREDGGGASKPARASALVLPVSWGTSGSRRHLVGPQGVN
jgi:hypothetical protein